MLDNKPSTLEELMINEYLANKELIKKLQSEKEELLELLHEQELVLVKLRKEQNNELVT